MDNEFSGKAIINPGRTGTRSMMWYVDWMIAAGVAGVVLIIAYMMFA